MADTSTTGIARYITEKGIKISALSRHTGISDGILRRCLSSQRRDLRADEFLAICRFLGRDPFDFGGYSRKGRDDEDSDVCAHSGRDQSHKQ